MNAASKGADMVSMGTVPEITKGLARFNTAPDGSARSASTGTVLLHGPGMIIELPTSTDEVMQAMATVRDDEFAWPVLSRICRELSWAMVDMNTGRRFG